MVLRPLVPHDVERDVGQEAQRLLQKSKQNSDSFENYAEVAMFYFWLSDANNMPLVRRGRYAFR